MELELFYSKSKIQKFELLSFAFLIPGLICLFIGDIDSFLFKLDVSCVLFFGFFSIYLFVIKKDKKVQISLSQQGLYYRNISDQFILWEQIKSCNVLTIYGQNSIQIDLAEATKIEIKLKSFLGLINKIRTVKKIALSLSFIECDEEKIINFIKDLIHSDFQKREKILKELTSIYYV